MSLASVLADEKGKKKPPSRLEGVLGPPRLERDILKVERELDIEPEGSVFERAVKKVVRSSFVSGSLDFISRTNFAVAGVYEEIVKAHGYGDGLDTVLKALDPSSVGPNPIRERVAKEMFSGVGPLQGEKKAFGEVFEDLGYGPGGSISQTHSFGAFFSESGEGFRLQRGGFFDFTARGVLGTALDITTDPLTYITLGTAATARQSVRAGRHYLNKSGVKALKTEFKRHLPAVERGGLTMGEADNIARKVVEKRIDQGAKLADEGGIKLFGTTLVPGEVFSEPAKSVSDGVVKFLHKSSLGEKVISVGEGVGRVFQRDFRVRDNPDYVARKQLYLTVKDNGEREVREMVEALFADTTKKDRVNITHYLDSGGKTPLDKKLLPLVNTVMKAHARMAKREQQLGLLDKIRLNYILHTYDRSPKRVRQVISAHDPERLSATLKGSEKARSIKGTLLEIKEKLAKEGIHPVEDSAELLMRRGFRHVHGVETHLWFSDVAKRWGVNALDDALEAGGLAGDMHKVFRALREDSPGVTSEELSKGIKPVFKGKGRAKKTRRGGLPIEEVRSLSEDSKKLFLHQRFARVQHPAELANVTEKYKEFSHLFPDTTPKQIKKLKTFNAEDMMEITDIKEFKGIHLPNNLAEDVIDFNKHFIDRKEIPGILWAYDKFMNSFKVGVTSIFPSFHFRNAYSNQVQAFTDLSLTAMNPRMHFSTVRMLAGDVNGSFTSKIGRVWGHAEVVYEAKRRGIIADYRNIFETFGDKIPLRTGKNKAINFIKHPIDTWKRFGGIIENEGRLALFSNYLRRGLDVETAAQRVNKILFDYKNLSRVERDVLARIFPFYRWTRKNIALQAERLIRNPGQAGIQAKLTRQNRTDPTLLPSYLRGDFVFTLEADKEGKLTFIRGLDLPITDLNNLGEPMQAIMSNISPLIKLLPELAGDQDFFRRRKISRTSTPLVKAVGAALDLLPQRVKDKMDFTKKTLRDGTVEYRMNPTVAHIIIKTWAISRVYGTAQRVLRSKSLYSGENFLDITTGIRLQDVDVDVAVENLEREYRDFLETKAVARGIRGEFSKTFRKRDRTKAKE